MDGSYGIAAGELAQFVEQIESLRAEVAEIKAREADIFAEAKARGYMTRPIRSLIKLRAQDPEQRAEEEAVLEMYKSALGM